MKKILIFSLALVAVSGAAQAKTAFEAAFERTLNYKCRSGYYLTSSAAEEIAGAVDADKFELNDFLNTYNSTCEYERAKNIATDVKDGNSDMGAFNQALNYKCRSGYYLTSEGAEEVAKGVAAGKYDVKTLLNAYNGTCEYERAKRIAADVKSGKSNLESFNRALNYKCSSGYYLSATGAEEVAQAEIAGQFNLNEFLNTYYKTCEYDRAKRVAKNVKAGKADLAAFDRTLNYKCKSGYYLTSEGAEDVANQVAAGKFELTTFLNMYYSTCEFDRSIRMAKASKASGGSKGSGDSSSDGGDKSGSAL